MLFRSVLSLAAPGIRPTPGSSLVHCSFGTMRSIRPPGLRRSGGRRSMTRPAAGRARSRSHRALAGSARAQLAPAHGSPRSHASDVTHGMRPPLAGDCSHAQRNGCPRSGSGSPGRCRLSAWIPPADDTERRRQSLVGHEAVGVAHCPQTKPDRSKEQPEEVHALTARHEPDDARPHLPHSADGPASRLDRVPSHVAWEG